MMKTKFIFSFAILLLCMACVVGGCSKTDYNQDDYITSILSGDYEKEGLWKLFVSENGVTRDDYGYVRFDSKNLKEGDFRFVNVIPGEPEKTFNNIPLSETENGWTFSIEFLQDETKIEIKGIISFGEMKIDLIRSDA